MMWCVGAFLELSDRIKLESFMRTNDEFTLDMPTVPEGSEDSMFDYFVNEQGMLSSVINKINKFLIHT